MVSTTRMTSQRARLAVLTPAKIAAMLCAFSLGLYAQSPKIPQGAIVINLDTNGAVSLDQQRLDLSTLSYRLQNTRTDATVVIVAAPNVAFKELVTTVETVRGAGIDRVGILKARGDGSGQASLPLVGATVLSVDRSGVVRLGGKKLKPSNVAAALRKLFKRQSDHTVYVQAYGALSFDAVGNVIDAAKAGGASRITLLASNQ